MLYLIKKKDILFLITITIYFTFLMLDMTVWRVIPFYSNVTRYVYNGCYLLAVIKILIDCYKEKNIWKIAIIAILIFLTIMQMSTNAPFYYFLMIVAAKDVNCRKIIKCVCIVQGTILAIFVFGSQLGLIENYLFLQDAGERYRYGLGFTYTTYAPTIFFVIMMAYIYLRRERMHIYEFVVFEAINYWLYIKTDSRMCFYLSTIMLVYVFFMRYFWQNRKGRIRKNRWLILAPSLICVGSICLNAFYNPDNTKWVAVNEFLNGRLKYGRAALDQYPITLFGQSIQWIGNGRLGVVGEYNYVDCSYVKVLLESGIVFLILVIIGYTYLMYMAIKLNNYYLQTILLFLLIFNITEARLTSLGFTPFLLLISVAWRTKGMEELNEPEPVLVPRFRIQSVQIRMQNRF